MKPAVVHRQTCRLCDSSRVERAVPIRPSPIADAYVPASKRDQPQDHYPLDLYLCLDCGHVQLLDVVNPEVLFADYLYTTSISLGLVEHFRRYVDAVTQRFPSPAGALAVDIGSNDGTVLRFFKEKGYRVLGIDPAIEIAKRATESGLETLPEFFTRALGETLRQRYGPAAVITANNVFAHADDLAGMTEGIRALLAPDGVFIFEVSYLADIIDKMLFDTVYHEHLCYHSIKPFCLFFHRHGLELFDVERLPTKGGSIRGFVQHRGSPRPVAPIVGDLLAEEAKTGLDRLERYRQYTARIEQLKHDLFALLRPFKAGGQTLAGFGASATVTTLLHHFELGPWLDFLVDDNASRHGCYSPGYHLPVLDPRAMRERSAAAVVILAWQYAEPIMKKHQDYREHGGRFLLPLPAVKMI
jgi:SAM-dependent methyltransferase